MEEEGHLTYEKAASGLSHVDSCLEVVGETEADKPEDPVVHVVKSGETLRSIAAFYDTTPSILARANRITSSGLIFPGDKLKIPPPEPPTPKASTSTVTSSRPSMSSRHSVVEEEEIYERQFIKINVRHVTDGNGVVLGSLLLTPKTVMFNPNATDLLVMESPEGPDQFQIIAPPELVVNWAVFSEFGRFNSSFGIATKESEGKKKLFVPKVEVKEDDPENGKDEEKSKDEEKPDEDEDDEEEGLKFKNEDKKRQSESDEPLYLRMVMGKPLAKKLPRSAPIMSYGLQTLEPEYWFIIQSDKAAKLYEFVQRIFPLKYGLLDHTVIERSGYEVIRPGVKLLEEESGQACNRESVSKLMRKTLTMTSVDIDLISEMIGTSELLKGDDRFRICRELPPRTDGHNWELHFSTTQDGFNLLSLYRKLARYEETPCLLLVEDLKGAIFGAYLTTTPKRHEHFMGTGETFVFTLRPEFQVFHWTGENDYFLKSSAESLVVGSANGKFALWIDGDLNKGRSEKCSTFDNEPLASKEDFYVKTIEVWAFVL